jgi:hypothetical protein
MAICLFLPQCDYSRYDISYLITNNAGSGTMIISCFYDKWSKTLFMVGVFQLFLAYILIGWLFSIYWGVLIVRKSWEDPGELQNFLDKTHLRSD